MLGNAGEVRTNTLETFSYGFLHMDAPVLADQQRLIHIKFLVDTECSLKDLPESMDDKDRWQKNQGTPSYPYDLMIMMIIKLRMLTIIKYQLYF